MASFMYFCFAAFAVYGTFVAFVQDRASFITLLGRIGISQVMMMCCEAPGLF